MITANIIIPEELHEAANHLAAAIAPGSRLADGTLANLRTFLNPNWQDDESQYIAVGVQVPDDWSVKVRAIQANPALLVRPEFDTANEIDLDAARAVAADAVILEAPLPGGEELIPLQLTVAIGFGVIPSSFTRIQED